MAQMAGGKGLIIKLVPASHTTLISRSKFLYKIYFFSLVLSEFCAYLSDHRCILKFGIRDTGYGNLNSGNPSGNRLKFGKLLRETAKNCRDLNLRHTTISTNTISLAF